jgi:very-short-patch-repair endonuclease
MRKHKWQQILERYSSQEELIQLLKSTPYTKLAEQWGCAVDCVYTLRKKLGIGTKRTDVSKFLQTYPKEVLEDLYLNKYDRRLGDMADGLNIYQDTLSKIFEQLGIEQKPHHPTEYQEFRDKISARQKELAKIRNPIQNVWKDPNWREKSDRSRVERGSAKKIHIKYRWMNSLNYQEILNKVKNINITEVAKELNVPRHILESYLKHNGYISDGTFNRVEENWAKGLTKETDPRIEKLSKKLSETRKRLIKEGKINMQELNKKAQDNFVSSIEALLKVEFDKRKLNYKEQVLLVDKFLVDFVVNDLIVVEADGCYYHGCKKHRPKSVIGKKRAGIDRGISAYLTKCGYKVFRFWEHDIKASPEKCIQQVVDFINSSKPQ